MEASLIPQSNHGTMDEEEDELGSLSSFSDDRSGNSTSSSSSEFMEDATSPSTQSPSSTDHLVQGPLYEMSSLMAQLPFKRGLSKHYHGKSQSFTSLSNVRSLEDLAKPERPCKKLKPCKSYGGGLDSQKSFIPKGCSRTISKKPSKGSLYSIMAKRHSFQASKPPIHPHRPSNISAQTLLFA